MKAVFRLTLFSILAWAFTASHTVSDAYAGKLGGEFRVNKTTAGDQWYPSVAALGDGGFVVTWHSMSQDGSGYGVYGQRYTVAGTKTGGEFRINKTTAGDQQYSSVTGLGDGGFVVIWFGDQDGSGYGVYGQRYTAAGIKTGGEFRVNKTTLGDQEYPSVTALGGGGFVVTWMSDGQDGSGWGVYGQRYNAAGTKLGSEFRINAVTASHQLHPSAKGLGGGGFVVTWHSASEDGSGFGVYGQRYDAAGAKAGGEFRVNKTTAGDQWYSSVAALGDGGFVVTWVSDGQDGSVDGVYGQRYSSSGAKVGGEFRVNTYTPAYQDYPSVTALGDGGFVVAWMSDSQDGSLFGVYGQRYSAAGTKVRGEFPINRTTADYQGYPSIAGLGAGGFVVIWMSGNQDGSGYGVYGQRYSP